MMTIYKEPLYENDDMLIEIPNFTISDSEFGSIINADPYIRLKFDKFKNKDVTFEGFEAFVNERPSLRNADPQLFLVGSIYTYAVGERNGADYEESIKVINSILMKNSKSRKAVLRMANSVEEYFDGEFLHADVSCLNLIHYYDGNVKLIFRASDITNELFADVITIYWFFIKPIFDKCNIKIYTSTAQNIDGLVNFKNKINNMEHNEKE